MSATIATPPGSLSASNALLQSSIPLCAHSSRSVYRRPTAKETKLDIIFEVEERTLGEGADSDDVARPCGLANGFTSSGSANMSENIQARA